jgi:hypothetical protein
MRLRSLVYFDRVRGFAAFCKRPSENPVLPADAGKLPFSGMQITKEKEQNNA